MKDDLQNRISEYSKLGESSRFSFFYHLIFEHIIMVSNNEPLIDKRSEEETKQYVNAINEVKEKLKHENEALKDIKKRLRENQEKQKQGKMACILI